MNRSTRGAAKVSIVWTICALVAFILALVMFFLTNGELANKTTELARRENELAASKKDPRTGSTPTRSSRRASASTTNRGPRLRTSRRSARA